MDATHLQDLLREVHYRCGNGAAFQHALPRALRDKIQAATEKPATKKVSKQTPSRP